MKSSQISGLGFQACWNLDFGVQVGLGKRIETMPLSSPSVLDLGFRFYGNYFLEFRVGLSVQMMRERCGCKNRGQISVNTEGYKVSRLENMLQK